MTRLPRSRPGSVRKVGGKSSVSAAHPALRCAAVRAGWGFVSVSKNGVGRLRESGKQRIGRLR